MQLPLVLGHDGVALELIHRQLVRRRAGLLLLRLLLALLALLPCPPLLPLSSTGGCCALSSASLLNPTTPPLCMRLHLSLALSTLHCLLTAHDRPVHE